MKYSPGPYDAAKCAAACTATTGYNSRHPRPDGTYDPCVRFFPLRSRSPSFPPLSVFLVVKNSPYSNICMFLQTELLQRILHPNQRRPRRDLLLLLHPVLGQRVRDQPGPDPRHEGICC